MKTILLILVVFLFVIVLVLIYIYVKLPGFKPEVTIIEIDSEQANEKIYIKRKVWGISADHRIVVISISPETDFEPNPNQEYVYKGFSPIFYRFVNDTLELFVNKLANIPSKMPTEIKINQIVLSNSEMMSLMEDYEGRGLSLIE